MAQTASPSLVSGYAVGAVRPPWSRAIRVAVGASLILGGLLNGLPQWLFQVVVGDMEFSDQIRWGTQNPLGQQLEQGSLLLSALFMPIGLLGIAQVTRWRAPRLTVVAVPLMLWGMWGFHTILALGYTAGVVAPTALPLDSAVRLNDAFSDHPGVLVAALLPHIVGSFVGILLLSIAAWRSGSFPRTACALLIAFLVWDFTLPSWGPLEPHLLLTVAWFWMGLTLLRMDDDRWSGGPR